MPTCTGVSFFHGSNDGQKGMGLVVLILVGLPGTYALNPAAKKEDLQKIVTYSQQVQPALDKLRQGDERKGQTAAGDLSDFLKAKVPRPRRRTPRWPARMTTSVMNLKVETATVT